MISMRMKFLRGALSLLPLVVFAACEAAPQPSRDAAKAIKIDRHADPRTLVMRGSVSVTVEVPQASLDHAEDYALEALKLEALRKHPSTTILFGVRVAPGSDSASYVVSGICAESRPD